MNRATWTVTIATLETYFSRRPPPREPQSRRLLHATARHVPAACTFAKYDRIEPTKNQTERVQRRLAERLHTLVETTVEFFDFR
jgi:hypothetical protein